MKFQNTILVWRFEDAPKPYQDLSTNGGDEDWVCFIPSPLTFCDCIPWIEKLGTCDVDQHPVPGGLVVIGAHS